MEESLPIKPITCPRCGNTELVYVSEYHKALGMRIILLISIGITIATFLSGLGALLTGADLLSAIPGTIFMLIIDILLYAMAIITESRTHVQAICPKCGNIWLLD